MKTLRLGMMTVGILCSANVYAMDIYGHTFCRQIDYNKDTVEAWKIHSDGLVDHIHPFAGMPDPSTFLRVDEVDREGFYVRAYRKSNGAFLRTLHRFIYSKDGSYLIQDHWRLGQYFAEHHCK